MFRKLYITYLIYVTEFVVIFDESEHFTLYSANQQREKIKTKLEMAETSEDCFFLILRKFYVK